MLFRPQSKERKVMADLYLLTPPDDPALENGNKLCMGKPIVYLIVWKSEMVGKETDLRTLAPFSGQKLNADLPDDWALRLRRRSELKQCVGVDRERSWVWRLANPPLIAGVPVGDFIRFR